MATFCVHQSVWRPLCCGQLGDQPEDNEADERREQDYPEADYPGEGSYAWIAASFIRGPETSRIVTGYGRQLLRPPSWTLWSRRHRYHSPRPLPLPEFTRARREGLRGQ
jgi:hypothetical protein